MLPEVVLLAETDHVIFRDTDFLGPDVVSLIIIQIDRDVELFGGNLQFPGQELPGPWNGLVLEIILEAEIAQHFKVTAMAGGDAHALNIGGADALLAGGDPVTGRLLLTKEPLLHGRHAAVDEKQARIVLGHQGEAAQTEMTLALKEIQILFPKFIQSCPLHVCRFSISIFEFGILPKGRRTKEKRPAPCPAVPGQRHGAKAVKLPWYHPDCRQCLPLVPR